MKIGKRFNQLTKAEYLHSIEQHKKYTDFNVLGLYRSICENDKLNLSAKLEVRDYAHQFFSKTFNFFQLKDPILYIELNALGIEMTVADENQAWEDLKRNQESILAEKRIKHRNFGLYSKHNCGNDACHLNGVMIQKGSWFAESEMCFDSDQGSYHQKIKSQDRKKQRKSSHRIIQEELTGGYPTGSVSSDE